MLKEETVIFCCALLCSVQRKIKMLLKVNPRNYIDFHAVTISKTVVDGWENVIREEINLVICDVWMVKFTI